MNLIRRNSFPFILVYAFLSFSPCHAAPDRVLENLDNLLNEYRVPGAGVALIENGKTTLHTAGLASFEPRREFDPEKTIFTLNSISKLFTSVVILDLVARGLINLNDPTDKWIRNFKKQDMNLRAPKIAELLTHTSGLELRYLEWMVLDRAQHLDNQQYLERFPPILIREPGQLYIYNNMNFVVAAYIAELVTGKKFSDLVSEIILEPLGMTRTSLVDPVDPQNVTTNFLFHRLRFKPLPFRYVQGTGTGSVLSTISDMSKLLGMLLSSRDDTTKSLMLKPQFFIAPGVRGNSFGMEFEVRGDVSVLSRVGLLYGSYSRLIIVPEKKFGIFITQNSEQRAFTDRVVGELMADRGLNAAASVPASSGKSLPAGAYVSLNNSAVSFDKLALLLRPGQYKDMTEADLGSSQVYIPSHLETDIFYERFDPFQRVPWYEDKHFHLMIMFGLIAFDIIFIVVGLLMIALRKGKSRLFLVAGFLSPVFNLLGLALFWRLTEGKELTGLLLLREADFSGVFFCSRLALGLVLALVGFVPVFKHCIPCTRAAVALMCLLVASQLTHAYVWHFWKLL